MKKLRPLEIGETLGYWFAATTTTADGRKMLQAVAATEQDALEAAKGAGPNLVAEPCYVVGLADDLLQMRTLYPRTHPHSDEERKAR